MEEEWVVIPEWPDYLVSNLGRVWSKKRDRPLKAGPNKHGYPQVTLSREGVYRSLVVHRCVASAFVEGYFSGAFVNHIDGVKTNNVYTNLEWVTHRENVKHAVETGLVCKLRVWREDEEQSLR